MEPLRPWYRSATVKSIRQMIENQKMCQTHRSIASTDSVADRDVLMFHQSAGGATVAGLVPLVKLVDIFVQCWFLL